MSESYQKRLQGAQWLWAAFCLSLCLFVLIAEWRDGTGIGFAACMALFWYVFRPRDVSTKYAGRLQRLAALDADIRDKLNQTKEEN